MRLNGDLGELKRLAAGVAEFCAAHGLDDEAEFQLSLVLEELFVNTVRHGGCADVPDCCEVQLESAAGGVEVEFRDRGPAFDPTMAPAPNLTVPLAERGDGGLGIHLVRQIMSEIRYRRDGEWNQLRMRRPAAVERGQPELPGSLRG